MRVHPHGGTGRPGSTLGGRFPDKALVADCSAVKLRLMNPGKEFPRHGINGQSSRGTLIDLSTVMENSRASQARDDSSKGRIRLLYVEDSQSDAELAREH